MPHLTTFSLPDSAARILQAALEAVEPGAAVERWLRRDGHYLIAADQTYDLTALKRVVIIGLGKAAVPMGRAAAQIVGDRLTSGLLLTKEGHAQDLEPELAAKLSVLEASHPIPDERGVSGTRQILALLRTLKADDLVICVISGGGSALLTAPVVPLEEMQALTGSLLACGASIHEINTLRKHLDEVKGGGLARAAAPARLLTLILSDVVGDPLDMIASGPTAPDSTTFAEAQAVIERYALQQQVSQRILARLQDGLNGRIADTPKAGDPLFERVQNLIVGSNRLAAEAALAQARAEGFHALLLTTTLQGEARGVGRMLASILGEIAASGHPVPRPACILAGGETTVTLTPNAGKGGRNQEMALSAVNDLAGLANVALVTLATDGGDGPTNAAGAVVTGDSLSRARLLGLDPADFLARHDAYHFFEPLGDLLITGPTRTNVNDLALGLALASTP